MGQEYSNNFKLFYRLHRFTHLSTRLAFSIISIQKKLFYQLQKMAIAIDVILSALFFITIFGNFAVFFSLFSVQQSTLFVMLAMNLISIVLIKCEKRERLINSTRPFSIYNMNTGSAKTLRNQVKVLHLFIDSPSYRWNKKRIPHTISCSKQATDWLKDNARFYKIPLKFDHQIIDQPIKFNKNIPEACNRYHNMKEFHELIQKSIKSHLELEPVVENSDNTCVFVHVGKQIRSYASPDYIGADQTDNHFEYCVLAKKPNPSTHAHELLHLFGADDYYAEYLTSLHNFRSEFMSKSIMFSGGLMSLDELILDELTAQNIGWL